MIISFQNKFKTFKKVITGKRLCPRLGPRVQQEYRKVVRGSEKTREGKTDSSRKFSY